VEAKFGIRITLWGKRDPHNDGRAMIVECLSPRMNATTFATINSGTMGQESGEIWAAETRLQPILPNQTGS
jgi:hypothetical protein